MTVRVRLPVTLRCTHEGCGNECTAIGDFNVDGKNMLRLSGITGMPEGGGWQIFRWVPGVLNNTVPKLGAFCAEHAAANRRDAPSDEPI